MFFGLRSVRYTEAEECEKWGTPGLIHHVSDIRWTQCGRKGEGTNRKYNIAILLQIELIHKNWPVQKVQSKNAVHGPIGKFSLCRLQVYAYSKLRTTL